MIKGVYQMTHTSFFEVL